jgi:hypothetical protein
MTDPKRADCRCDQGGDGYICPPCARFIREISTRHKSEGDGPKVLREVPNHAHHTAFGDYWFDSDGKVCLSCPYCGALSWCPHEVVQRNPLTLRPSVIEHPCKHHFNVINGVAQ